MHSAIRANVETDRFMEELLRLAEFSATPPPSVTRVVFSPQDIAARQFLKERFREADLEIREDPVGNTFAKWTGSDPELPAVISGSHIDAIPHAGRYDGTVGVVGALEAIRALKSGGFRPRRSIQLVVFTSEEPTRYGLGCLGSRLMSGTLAVEQAAQLVSEEEASLDVERQAAGFHGALAEVPWPRNQVAAFVELHIEQGPVLEREQMTIGAVTSIAAPAAFRVRFTGQGGHAGAVLMPDRCDALLAGAELALAVERSAIETGGEDTVATTGVFEVHPGAVNSIPSQATLEIDLRDTHLGRRDRVLADIQRQASEIAERRKQQFRVDIVNADPPASCDDRVVATIERSARDLRHPVRRMISRAYHDALFMAALGPIGMIFIPCRDGISHRPDEFVEPNHVRAGVEVLAATIANLSES